MRIFRHGDYVKLTDASNRSVMGVLHLPDVGVPSTRGTEWLPRFTEGGYGVHTLRMPDGSLFRTEGRLS